MKNQYTVNKKLFMEWAKEYHLVGARSIISFVLFCLVGLISLTRIISAFIYSEFDGVSLFTAIFIMAIYFIFFSRFVFMARRYEMLARTYGVEEWVKTIEFADDEIIIYDHNNVSRFMYDSIFKIKEKDEHATILLKSYVAIRVYKDKFIEGSWEECKRKIESMI